MSCGCCACKGLLHTLGQTGEEGTRVQGEFGQVDDAAKLVLHCHSARVLVRPPDHHLPQLLSIEHSLHC